MTPNGTMTIVEGARRLAALADGMKRLEDAQAQVVHVWLGERVEEGTGPVGLYSPIAVPVSRTKLIELLRAEEEYVGQRLARILGEAYKSK